MDNEELENQAEVEDETEQEEESGSEETNDVETDEEGEESSSIESMIDKIIDGENTAAQQDFEALISAKLNDALEAKKQELASSIYSNTSTEEEPQEA